MNAWKLIPVIVAVLLLPLCAVHAAPSDPPIPVLAFSPGDNTLYPDYRSNRSNLNLLEAEIVRYEDIILSGNGHIELTAYVSPADKDNPIAINMAATRAAVVRTHLIYKFRMLTRWCFTFHIGIDASMGDSVHAFCLPGRVPADAPTDIYYSTRPNNVRAVSVMLAKYDELPFLPSDRAQRPEAAWVPICAAQDVQRQAGDGTETVAIYYRWDRSELDSLYLSNPQSLRRLDSLLTSVNARQIDTLTIAAYASPEGDSLHNMRLSERRASTLRDYIVKRYDVVAPAKVFTVARGENWEGMVELAEADLCLPSRDKALDILRSPMSGERKQIELTRLDDGKTYYRYILPNYYTYLRLGAMVFMSYTSGEPDVSEPGVSVPDTIPDTIPDTTPEAEIPASATVQEQMPKRAARYPVALKTNLLYDMVGAANLGVEIPLGRRWSVIGAAAYSYWRSSKNLYALQTLEYGISGRYWLPVSSRRILRNPEWDKPLRGWYFGIYGRYWQRYDVQWKDGVQGDGSWSAGVTAGYAFPIARNLSFDAGLGVGYFSTSEYRTYDRPLYDKDGKYHLMWRQTGTWRGFALTKVNFSLVWLIETKKGTGK